MSNTEQSILIVGAGGLGTAAGLYLAQHLTVSSTIRICDFDVVERSNLHRQVLYTDSDIASPKAEVLSSRLASVCGQAMHTFVPIYDRFTRSNAATLLEGVRLVLDASDSPESKFLLNALCVEGGIPLIHAAAAGVRGQAMLVHPPLGTACLQCVFEAEDNEAENCQEAGIFGPFVAALGMLQAQLAIDILAGHFSRQLYHYTMKPWRSGSIEVLPQQTCEVCAKHQVSMELNTARRVGDE